MGKRRDARRAARAAAFAALGPTEPTAEPVKASTLVYYLDDAGEWRWHLVASNHRIIADSGQGYRDRRNAIRGWAAVSRAAIGGHDTFGLDP